LFTVIAPQISPHCLSDNPDKISVHPSIPQGERRSDSLSVSFSVRGEVSNHERKHFVDKYGQLSDSLDGVILTALRSSPFAPC